MSKRGQIKPFRTVFTYPNGVEGREAALTYDVTEINASKIAKRGGTAQVILLTEEKEEIVMAVFGPDVTHTIKADPTPGSHLFVCSCSDAARREDPTRDHLDRAGVCRFCWDMPVRDAATFLPSTCPACDGTGDGEEAYYGGYDPKQFLVFPQPLARSLMES